MQDDPGLTTLFRTILETAHGVVVRVENDAASDLATALTFTPHLIVLDGQFSSTSGLEVAVALRCVSILSLEICFLFAIAAWEVASYAPMASSIE